MELVWNWIAAPGWLAALVALAMAGFLYRSAPTRRLNRRLAILFLVEGATMLALMGLTQIQGRSTDALAWFLTGWAFYLALPFAYLLFIAELDSVLSRPLRNPIVIGALALATAGVELYFLTDGTRYIAGVEQLRFGWEQLVTPLYQPYVFVLAGCYLYGLAAAIDAWRRAKTPVLRRRMKAFAIAFGTRDVLFAAHAMMEVVGPSLPNGEVLTFYLVQLSLPLITLVYVPLVAYAILRTQLFDVDLKIKLGLSRGAVAALIVIAFELVFQIAQTFATQGTSLVSGLVVAGGLALVAMPLSRAADRVADRIMPNVRDTDEYRRRRRAEMQVGLLEERFEPQRELGRGGEGRVTLALDRDLEREVVLKEPVVRDATTRDRVLREARLAARVSHPNIVTIYQVLPDAERPVIVMEHVAGGSLQDALAKQGKLPSTDVIRIGTDVLRGLERMHREGLLHRDLKPSNVLLDPSGHAKVADFGLAGEGRVAGGTPEYMSPEQARGDALDARSDVYSVGMLLRRALGSGPDGSATVDGRAGSTFLVRLAPLDAPPKLAAVLDRAVAKDPAARYASAGEMLFALEAAR